MAAQPDSDPAESMPTALPADELSAYVVAPHVEESWLERWSTEWGLLRQEAERLRQEREQFEQHRREVLGDFELQRRQIQNAWTQLGAWQDERKRSMQQLTIVHDDLHRRSQLLSEAEDRFESDRLLQAATIDSGRIELEALEARIHHHRQKLALLQDEVVGYETELCNNSAARLAASTDGGGEPNGRRECRQEIRRLLDDLQQIAEALLDQGQVLKENQNAFSEIRAAWHQELDRLLSLAEAREDALRVREEDLRPREERLELAEIGVQQTHERLADWEQCLHGLEGRLRLWETGLLARRDRILSCLEGRAFAAQLRREQIIHVCKQWQQLQQGEADRCEQIRQSCELAREGYLKARESLRLRMVELDQRERQLLERELVVTQIEQQLINQDPDPVAAQRVLEEKRRQWTQLVARQDRAVERRTRLLDRRARQLEVEREELADERGRLDRRWSDVAMVENLLNLGRDQLVEADIQRHEQLRLLQEDREILARQVRELERQIEHLAAVLVAPGQATPALGLAA